MIRQCATAIFLAVFLSVSLALLATAVLAAEEPAQASPTRVALAPSVTSPAIVSPAVPSPAGASPVMSAPADPLVAAPAIAAMPTAQVAPAQVTTAVSTPLPPAMTTATPTAIPAPTPTSFAGSFQMMFGMFVVLALLFGITWMLKKYGPVKSGNSTTVKIVGGISVGNRERIVVVEVADQWIVVGVAPGRVNTLSTMPKQDGAVTVTADAMPPQKNFAAWLKQTIDKRNAG